MTDGAVRDVDEMTNAGFKALARCMCVGHAYSTPIRWDCDVEVFGRKVQPGQLIHADKHGFLPIPFGEEQGLLDAARFMDSNECKSIILTGRNTAGKTMDQILEGFDKAGELFARNVKQKFGKKKSH
ncbi:MAG: RraA family protein [Planctomycetota bacterium]